MIVKAAGLRRHEIARLATVILVQHANRIDLRAVGVIGMRIGGHVVLARIVVHECDARADRHRELFGTDAARAQREGVGIARSRRWSG